MGNEVNLTGNQLVKNNIAGQNKQNFSTSVESDNSIFKSLPLKSGDKVVVVNRNTGKREIYECDCAEPTAQPAQINNNFGNLTKSSDADFYGGNCNDYPTNDKMADLSKRVADLITSEYFNPASNQLENYQSQASHPNIAANRETVNSSDDNIYDIAYQTAIQNLKNELNKGNITSEQFIEQVKKLKNTIETYAKQEVQENRAEEIESINEDLTTSQQKAIDKYLKNDNKLFKREDFKPNAEISGIQEASKEMSEVGIVKTVKVLADGTTVEITENKNKEGFMAGILGKRGGIWTGITGGLEIASGYAVAAGGILASPLSLGSTGVVGVAAGLGLAADGARRMNEAATASQAFTAVITKPDGSKQIIKNNYREDFYNELFKNIGIIK